MTDHTKTEIPWRTVLLVTLGSAVINLTLFGLVLFLLTRSS